MIAGNDYGLEYLKKKGAFNNKITDKYGKTPLDYLSKAQISPIKVDQLPEQKGEMELDFLDPLFSEYKVVVSEKPLHYQAETHDFGIEIKKILTVPPAMAEGGLSTHHIADSFFHFAKKAGIEIDYVTESFVPRDCLIRNGSGKISYPCHSPSTIEAILQAHSRSLQKGNHSRFLSTHWLFKARTGASYHCLPFAVNHMANVNAKDIPTLPFYLEGGNYLILTNSGGKKVAILAEDSFMTAFLQMKKDKIFLAYGDSLSALQTVYRSSLEKEEPLLRETIEEMYQLGLLKKGPGLEKGHITEQEINLIEKEVIIENLKRKNLKCEKKNQYLLRALEMQKAIPMTLSGESLKKAIPLAAKFLAEKSCAKTTIIKALATDEIAIIPQAAYHLDTFLKAAPPAHSVFLQNYDFTKKMAEELSKKTKELGLTQNDFIQLNKYHSVAEELHEELGNLLKQVQISLEEAGFTVIQAPAVFFDTSPDKINPRNPDSVKSACFNFMNAISGWSKKIGYYWGTFGVSCGDNLGKVFMGAFARFLRSYSKELHVEYIGENPNKAGDFQDAMAFFNVASGQGGIRCHTLELETASHHEMMEKRSTN